MSAEQDQPRIELDEAAEVMTILAAMDRWLQVTDEAVKVWAYALNAKGVRLEDAQDAAYRLLTTREKADATPGLLLGEVYRMRRERVAAGRKHLLPPDRGITRIVDGREVSTFPEWLRAAENALGDGLAPADAMRAADLETGGKRRALGPSTGRDVRAAIEGGAL